MKNLAKKATVLGIVGNIVLFILKIIVGFGYNSIAVISDAINSFTDIIASVIVYDKPSIEISELVHPEEVGYKDVYEISFILNKKSRFAPYNISIRVEPLGKEWELNQLTQNRKLVLKMYGSELRVGENNFKILIKYEDKNGKSYETSKEFSVRLVNVNIFQRIVIFFKHIFGG